MTQPIKLDTSGSQFVVSIDKDFIGEEDLLKFLDYLRVKRLVEKMDLGEDIEVLGKEIKAKWWAENKDRFIPKEEQ